jgi:hypothetical protein
MRLRCRQRPPRSACTLYACFSREPAVGAAHADFRYSVDVANDAAVASDRGGCRRSWHATRLHLTDPLQRLVPSPLQFRCYQAVGRIDRIVLPEGTIGSVSPCFEIPAQGIAYFVTLGGRLPLGLQRRGDRAGRKYLRTSPRLGSVIDPNSASHSPRGFRRLLLCERTPS